LLHQRLDTKWKHRKINTQENININYENAKLSDHHSMNSKKNAKVE